METCENCGCKVHNGKCANCDEELFILEQYDELEMDYPDEESEFMKNVNKSLNKINYGNNRKY